MTLEPITQDDIVEMASQLEQWDDYNAFLEVNGIPADLVAALGQQCAATAALMGMDLVRMIESNFLTAFVFGYKLGQSRTVKELDGEV